VTTKLARGRLLLALVNPRFALTGRIMQRISRAVGEPFYWPTAREMRREVWAAGFHVERQVRLFRLPGALLLPPVLTVATAREWRPRAAGPHAPSPVSPGIGTAG
jgi:hypothetical protein